MEIEIVIYDNKSNVCDVKGVAIVDGIRIPFTAYRYTAHPDPAYGQFDAVLMNHVAVRSKSGILNKYPKTKDHIKAQIRNAAKGWWIDNNFWR